jgi:hypothetical protein
MLSFSRLLPNEQDPDPSGYVMQISPMLVTLAFCVLCSPISLAQDTNLPDAPSDIASMDSRDDAGYPMGMVQEREVVPWGVWNQRCRCWTDKTNPSKTMREVFNKKFVIVHGILLASFVYDAEITHAGLAHHKCLESNTQLGLHPSRWQLYSGKGNLFFLGGLIGLDLVSEKFLIPYVPYLLPLAGAAKKFTAGTSWLTGSCW